VHANEVVARDRLIDELWGDAAPATVNAALSGYLTKLRRTLANGDGANALSTQPAGYVLSVAADDLDAHHFEWLVATGRAALAHGDPGGAAETLRKAMALWRGPALADLAYEQFAQPEIRRLEALRLSALEERIEADLALGQHESLVAELDPLVAEHPYRERLRAQLMLALYRSGRQAEALEAYQAARRMLVDDLGIEPGRRLQELERAILSHDPSLDAPAAAPPLVPAGGSAASRRVGRRWIIGAAAAIVLVAGLGILNIVSGKEGGTFFEIFASVVSNVLDAVYARIDLSSDRDKRVAQLKVQGLGEFRVEPIKNPVTGEEHRAAIKLPNGFEYKEAEMGNCVENYATLGGKVISNKNSYAHFAAVEWSNA